MFNNTSLLFMVLFFTTLIMYLKMQYHLISILLTIEFMTLLIFTFMSLYSFSLSYDSYSSFFFLSIAVCEGVLGLTLIVLFTRSKGSDLFFF